MKTKIGNAESRKRFLQPVNLKQTTGLETIYQKHSAIADPLKLGTEFRFGDLDASKLLPDITADQRKTNSKKLEISVGKPDFLPAWFLQEGSRLVRTVCKIVARGINYEGAEGEWSGTGFMVSHNILLTNNHVLNSTEVSQTALCIFDYQLDVHGQKVPTKEYRMDPERLFITSPADGGLDFTFVWVNGQPGKEFGFAQLDRAYFKVFKGDCANIIQHPNGELKSVVLQENRVLSQGEAVVHYSSDTEPGSSGSCVFNNLWKLTALHHASDLATEEELAQEKNFSMRYVNEGIKFSAIATYLENVAQTNDKEAEKALDLLQLFDGTDSAMGFFGSLGRINPRSKAGFETVTDSYFGELSDIDVGFWNVEWFNKNPDKVEAVAEAIADMNLDIWAFEEASPSVTEKLVNALALRYGLDFDWAASEPDAPDEKQTTTVIWNKKTVSGKRDQWPDAFDPWFKVDSRDFDELRLEAVHGKVFDRYPGLFYFECKSENKTLDFYLVPLHLKAKEEGSKRRTMAGRVLAAAVKKMVDEFGKDSDWILGGDFNAELATNDFNALFDTMVSISAEDETSGAFSYLKSPKSLIDHIFLSANLSKTYGAKDFYILAKEKTIPKYLEKLSDHRPVLVRLSLGYGEKVESAGKSKDLPEDLKTALFQLPSMTSQK